MTSQFLKKAVVVAIGAIGFSAAYADVTISNGGLVARVNDAGTFASYFEVPGAPVGTPGLSYNGTEFVNWGTPISWYWLEAGGASVASLGSNPLGASTSTSGSGVVATTLSFGALSLTQTMRALTGGRLQVTVSIFNDSALAISGVKWGVGIDPDQGLSNGTGFSTTNEILGQDSAASVRATSAAGSAPSASITLKNDTSAAAFAIKAYVDPFVCCSPVDPASALAAAQLVGSYGYLDRSISLAYDLGTLDAFGTASIGYSYIMTAVPEPEIYAMMAAGLGLMGFVARRRKQQASAV